MRARGIITAMIAIMVVIWVGCVVASRIGVTLDAKFNYHLTETIE